MVNGDIINLNITGTLNYNSYGNQINNEDIQEVIIGATVTILGTSAFNSCTALQYVTIPDSVTTIGTSAFASCSLLQNVTIPDSVTTIGNNAFKSCLNCSQ